MSLPELVPLLERDELERRVAELGRRVEDELSGRDPLLLGLIGGSVIFLADLLRAIPTPLRFELVHVDVSRQAGAAETVRIHFPIPVEVSGQDLLVIKDVVGSGVIESYLQSQLLGKGAHSVRFAALVDLPEERKTGFTVDYCVLSTHRAARLVGYGMKMDGRYGNLPYIASLADAPGAES